MKRLGLLAARKDSGYDIVTDAGMYVFNTHSRNELESVVKGTGLNMCAYTLPYELNSSELKSVGGLNSELIVYGRVPGHGFKAVCKENLWKVRPQEQGDTFKAG